ncbi:CoA-binding protein [Allopusillimonas soli]|uniref:Acetate--CoA ligase family protein n=1 Tax=Allopusillimonas soli TaxID=659016 RepID=A0A853FBM9_9BURK|nr:acetate--CoA ligase family protein [Allopusillimonas soli]NYT35951.1 acetate--CoA ligase family protein [Allopusillimonas soli]TEA76300.1 CoA-binding protein [Allopusillimonas soli]
MSTIDSLFRPRSVAIVGASADPAKTSGKPLAYLRKHGYAGAIYPVNPKVSHIDGVPCFPDIASLPQPPDVAIVMLSADRAIEAVRELAAKGTAAAIVLASGYAELGEDGARRQQALKQAAGSMRLLGPNTIGLVNLTDGIPLSASGALEAGLLPAGNIALVSQSGGILGSLLSRAAAQGIGFSKLVSTSNEADLGLADIIDALVDDAATHVIALYMETLRDPVRFRRVAARARAAGKPIVAFKIGRSESGARSAVSHTGAMSGADRMYEALFSDAGIWRVYDFADLLNVPAALAVGRKLRGKRVAILTSTGGAGTLVADSLGLAGFETPVPDAATSERLRSIQHTQSALDRNPIDVTLAGLDPQVLRSAISALMDSDTYDGIVAVVGSSALAQPDLMADAIGACLHLSAKPVIAYVSPHAPHITARLNQRGIPAFNAPEACAAAFLAMHALPGGPASGGSEAQMEGAREAVNTPNGGPSLLPAGLAQASGTLDEASSKLLFARFGIPSTRETVVHDEVQAQAAAVQFGGSIALKILSADITHKRDVGGVALGLDAQSVGPALASMRRQVLESTGHAPRAFLVQEMITDADELLLGLARDSLGSAILLGAGGTHTELLSDTQLRMQPLDRALRFDEAMDMLRSLKTWSLLTGYRGQPPRDVQAMARCIQSFSEMVLALGDRLREAEINPMFVRGAGKGVVAGDGVVVID